MAEDRSVLNKLFDAIAEGDLESIKVSLEWGANVNEKLGWSPLHAATFAGNLDIVKFLVQNGAQLDVKDKWGNKTPLEYADMFCNVDIVNYFKAKSLENSKKLAEEDAKKKAEEDGKKKAEAENNADIVNHFKKMSLENSNKIAQENSKKMAEEDAKKKAEAENMIRNRLRNKPGTLFYVAGKKSLERARAESPPVHYRWARANKAQEKAQEKAKKKDEKYNKIKADVEGFNKFLFDAIGKGNLRDVKYCLQNGANINGSMARGQFGNYRKLLQTPLHAAVSCRNLEIMKILLQNGADVNATDEDGFTPIHIAAYNGNLQMVKTLLQSGSDIQLDKKDNTNGRSALHVAVYDGNLEIVKVLVQKGANINAKDDDGFSPLHIAVYIENLKILKILIQSGAQLNAKDKKNKTPLDYARMWNIYDILKYLNNLTKAENEANISSANVIMDGDYYSILGVRKGARLNDELKLEMKRVYKRLALEYHPDKNESADAIEKFKKIKKAYEVLTDPQKKKVYDQYGEEGLNKKNWN